MEYQMIGSQAFTAIIMMMSFGLFVPLIAAIVWTKVKKDKFTTVLLGAAGFAAFAIILEAIPKAILFNRKNILGVYVMSHNWSYILVGALLAGIFEETARFFVFKVIIKGRKNKATAVSYGIGHGGIEIMYLFISAAVNNLIYAILINIGGFGAMVEQMAAIDPSGAEQLNQIAAALVTLNPADTLLGFWERISAMLFHIACSIIVFRGVREKGKIWLYPVAILLHTGFDCVAGMYQVGIIRNVYAVEGIFFGISIAVFAVSILMYKKMPDVYDSDEDDAEAKQLEDIKKLGL